MHSCQHNRDKWNSFWVTRFCNDATGKAYDKNMRLNIYGENHVTKKMYLVL